MQGVINEQLSSPRSRDKAVADFRPCGAECHVCDEAVEGTGNSLPERCAADEKPVAGEQSANVCPRHAGQVLATHGGHGLLLKTS